MKKIAILQSNYIPWKGYFDLIAAVDEFIFYDEVQYTKNDWRNRNIIKSPTGNQWLTVPTGQNIDRRICDVSIDARWQIKHLKTLKGNYSRASQYKEVIDWIESLYMGQQFSNLSNLNQFFIKEICQYLGIATKLSNSWDYGLIDGKNERLIDLCIKSDASTYISGPSAKNYIDTELFLKSGIEVSWFDYSGYPEYSQLWGEFTHGVSIIDLIFNCGSESPKYMRHVK